jgi:hypothetical protein
VHQAFKAVYSHAHTLQQILPPVNVINVQKSLISDILGVRPRSVLLKHAQHPKACKLGEEELRALAEEAAKEIATELRRKKDRTRVRARRQSTKDDKQLRAFSYAAHAYERCMHSLPVLQSPKYS